MDLSIVIITWNAAGLLDRCLKSIIVENPPSSTYEVIVVDNGSIDHTVDVTRQYTNITLIRNEKNRGVAPARNQGLAKARGRYLMILDVDTIVGPGALDRLVAFLDANPRVGLVGSRLVYRDGSLQYSCRRYPTLLSKVARRLPVSMSEKLLRREYFLDRDHTSCFPVDYVIGACQVFRREAYEQVGPLDEKIFYGPEDVDYCLRMWKAGWQVYYVGDASIVHDEQRITKRKLFSKITWRHAKALFYFFRKHRYAFSAARLPGCDDAL